MPRLTKANLAADNSASDVADQRQRDDDEISVASAASTFSAVSFHPTRHAARRQDERDIETGEIKRSKRQGCMSLAIRFTGDENKEAAEIDAHDWGAKLTAVFERLQMGDVKIRGAPGHRRIEVEIRGSEKMARQVKHWLTQNSYFVDPRRVLYVLRQGPQEELVVVEGPLPSGVVGVITVFRRDSSTGMEKRTENSAIILYNGVFWDLLAHNADEQALEAAFREQVFREPGIPCWAVGPGGQHFQLFNWPPKTPFLHAAAMMGCAKIVRQLVEQYGCDRDINHPRTKDKGTALHVAAYYGHSAVVELLLLKLGADKAVKNKYSETALDCAHQAKKKYMEGSFEMPKMPKFADESEMFNFNPGVWDAGIRVDFRSTNPDWPGWDQIIRLLDDDAAPVAMIAVGHTVNPGKSHTDEELEEFDLRPRKPNK